MSEVLYMDELGRLPAAATDKHICFKAESFRKYHVLCALPRLCHLASFCGPSLRCVHVGQVKPEDVGSILAATNHTWWWHNPEDYSLSAVPHIT
jgi:hypothetical protein